MGGRRHLVIRLGHRRAAWLYAGGLALSYAVVVLGVVAARFPVAALLALLTAPLAVRSAWIAVRHGQEHEAMVPALGTNVVVVLGTDLLLAIAWFVDRAMA
jgi:1,4-dihydroxy-2-naphthoate octaprenyltransferase